MEEHAVMRLFERWHRHGDEQALQEGLPWLERWLLLPPDIVRVLGQEAAEEIRAQVIEKLLLEKQSALFKAEQPRAFARATLKHRLLDALRRQARMPDVHEPGVAEDLAAETLAHSVPDVVTRLHEAQLWQRLVQAVGSLRLEERVALLLLHAPDRLLEEDWRELEGRHRPPRPFRPADAISRDDIAALLFPGTPERVAYERTGKLIQRAYARLRQQLAVPSGSAGEEPS
ncbi:hypothetical protein ATI61_106313 [Archangium gephyra]|uniref:Uncharacterized protein n=2 Tax=Archangium gephyra TaxID=48 RepID=A0ABX9K0W0_9BACT|nr:hypothetical protein [Archangium gephyra]REG30843.1 hypothetical protein ATI61_106313 [Archangium gephyra]